VSGRSSNRGAGLYRAVTARGRQAATIVRRDGLRGLGSRVGRAVALRLPAQAVLPVFPDDAVAVDLADLPSWRPPAGTGDRLTLNWVMAPPSAGSGGHTTLMRLVRHLEERGHLCRIYLYDRFDGEADRNERRTREIFPFLAGPVLDARAGMADADVVLATSWATAYPVARSAAAGRRAYVVQDFEPSFYASGALALLAENTYRMGMHAITAGGWLTGKLAEEYGMPGDHFDFGCDTSVYRLTPEAGPREGVVFYAKPSVPRRGYELGILALDLFHRARPDVPIHMFGEVVRDTPFPVHNHGKLTTTELNLLYNRCLAGLSLSLTNVSLIPWELLASGCLPVVNDAVHNRVVLDQPHVVWSAPTPHALAQALVEVVDRRGVDAEQASAGVSAVTWDVAGRQVEQALVRLVDAPDRFGYGVARQPLLRT